MTKQEKGDIKNAIGATNKTKDEQVAADYAKLDKDDPADKKKMDEIREENKDNAKILEKLDRIDKDIVDKKVAEYRGLDASDPNDKAKMDEIRTNNPTILARLDKIDEATRDRSVADYNKLNPENPEDKRRMDKIRSDHQDDEEIIARLDSIDAKKEADLVIKDADRKAKEDTLKAQQEMTDLMRKLTTNEGQGVSAPGAQAAGSQGDTNQAAQTSATTPQNATTAAPVVNYQFNMQNIKQQDAASILAGLQKQVAAKPGAEPNVATNNPNKGAPADAEAATI